MPAKFITGIDVASQKITSVASPSATTDAANKAYVDNVAAGLSWKTNAIVASAANLTLSGTQTVDGIALTAGQRVFAMGQTIASQNGPWVVASGAWTRPADFASASTQLGAVIGIEKGTTYADKAYVLTSDEVVVDTTAQVWSAFTSGSGTTYTAGSGITITSNVIAATGTQKYAVTISGTATTVAITHGLNTTDIDVQVFDVTTATAQVPVTCDWVTSTSTPNVVTLTFAVAPNAGQFRVVVVG